MVVTERLQKAFAETAKLRESEQFILLIVPSREDAGAGCRERGEVGEIVRVLRCCNGGDRRAGQGAARSGLHRRCQDRHPHVRTANTEGDEARWHVADDRRPEQRLQQPGHPGRAA
jgi:hypothetical protein